MQVSNLQKLSALWNNWWRYVSGDEDVVNKKADCSGFAFLCLTYLGFAVRRWSTREWYANSAPEFACPAVVSVPGHMGLLISDDLVIDLIQVEKESKDNPVRTVSFTDWAVYNTKVGITDPVHFFAFSRLPKQKAS